jgi:putative spermidine/putrescine transport system ATP-binding protein
VMNRLSGHVQDGIFSCKSGKIAAQQIAANATSLLFRPEDIRISGDDEIPALRGTVTAAVFMGDRTRLLVDAGEAQALIVDSHARREFKCGDSVGLHVDPSGIIVL